MRRGGNGTRNGNEERKIKGGGRAIMSTESHKDVLALLCRLSEETMVPKKKTTTNEPNGEGKRVLAAPAPIISKHEQKQQEKRFLQRLVRDYEHKQWKKNQRCWKGNSSRTTSVPATVVSNSSNNTDDKRRTRDGKQTNNNSSNNSNSNSSNAKVRLELVEAIFKKDKEDTKQKKKKNGKDTAKEDKDKKKKKKQKQEDRNTTFTEGGKKLVVVPTSTTRSELLQLGHTKLRMKQKPVRVFVKTPTSILVEFEDGEDVSALRDGTSVYVSTTAKEDAPRAEEETEEQTDQAATHTGRNAETREEEDDDDDPLEVVKRAYGRQQQAQRRHYQQFQQQKRRTSPAHDAVRTATTIIRTPPQQQHYQAMTVLRAHLPAAAYKATILTAVAKNRVLVLCGATGCGKSTQV